jgi:hypothetical protein
MLVVMAGIDPKHVLELPSAEDEQPVEALASHAADPALGVCVPVGCPNGRADHGQSLAQEDLIEAAAELRVTVVDEEAERPLAIIQVISRLRACWATQAPVGFGVRATNSIRRL